MHLIFDLDGTLIDSRAGIVDSLKFATYEVLGTKINSNLLRIGPPIKNHTVSNKLNQLDQRVVVLTRALNMEFYTRNNLKSVYLNINKLRGKD